MCLGDKDVDGGGGDVHPGLAASSALQCAGQDVPRYQLVSWRYQLVRSRYQLLSWRYQLVSGRYQLIS